MKPAHLYKYQPFSIYSLQNLKNNCIYFNDPKSFNDPYDTTQPVEIQNPDSELITSILFRSPKSKPFQILHDKLNNGIVEVGELADYFVFLSYHFTAIRDELVSHFKLKNEDAHRQIFTFLNENPDSFKEQQDYARQILQRHASQLIVSAITDIRNNQMSSVGVSCFSEKYDDLLMWSYYADGHKGFCLEFDTNYPPFTKIHKVNYVASAPKIDSSIFFKDINEPSGLVESYLTSKYIDWSHEKEWRVLHVEKNKEFHYATNALSGIYIGSKMDLVNFEILALILKGQSPNIKFYQMHQVNNTFKVEPRMVTYTTFQEAKELVLAQVKSHLSKGPIDKDKLLKEINLPASKDQILTILEAIIDDFNNDKRIQSS